MKPTIHLIPNAHIDPVWLWDWREGMNEAITTCRTVLDLMDEFEELTFIRGEAAIYRHLEQYDPKSFRRIERYVAEGRWELVGGTWVQCDTNLPGTETIARQFAHGQRYFLEKFGRPVQVAWAADSFGHSAGLPDIFVQGGIRSFAFTRPAPSQLALGKDAFWWEGAGGGTVLAYRPSVGWYGTERDESKRRLDEVRLQAGNDGLENVACFVGLGNHGGGPTRRQIREIAQWIDEHPDIRVVYSGLHRFFNALSTEVRRKGAEFLPTHRGDLNFTLRGCYSSVAKFKYAYRALEATVRRSERTDAIIGAALRTPTGNLRSAWEAVLMNSFHDILPGSSIERAYDDQIAWMGGARHEAQKVEFDALNTLSAQIDMRVRPPAHDHPTAVPFLVWNPHAHPFHGHVELEAGLDSRPIWSFEGKPDELPIEVRGPSGKRVPFQPIATESRCLVHLPWRKRVLIPVTLPPMGWSVFTLGWVKKAPADKRPAVKIPVKRRGDSLVFWNRTALSAITVEDPWGAWGGMKDEPESLDLSTVRDRWTIARIETIEKGPERSSLWIQMRAGNSWLELRISQERDREVVDIHARLLWNERSARLKLVFSNFGEIADFEVPGGSIRRTACGEVPGGRWVRADRFGFSSDSLYNFDMKDGALRVTVVRASRYGDDVKTSPEEMPWLPASDVGEHRFRFLLAKPSANLLQLAGELEEPPVVHPAPGGRGGSGHMASSGSLLKLTPETLQILALKEADDGKGFILRIQETSGKVASGKLVWLGKVLALGKIDPHEIATWRLGRGVVRRTGLFEENLLKSAQLSSPNRGRR